MAAIASLREPLTTMGGVNLVAGFRPALWREVAPDDAPAELEGFDQDVVGVDGFVMPATQHDGVLWLSGGAYDVIFDVSRGAIAALRGLASVAEETSSWPYQHDRDLTGFIDGTENPSLIDAPELVVIPEGEQRPLATMLESMAGLSGGTRDDLTRYTRALTGAYYFVPSTESLRRVAGDATSA